ncbi:MAG: glycosyltransferase [Sphingomonadales bacterium]|nr:glycosyltransferase [Sphingomonadales bacterium]
MKVSIITVCYNSARTLQETIESVLSQTYTNIEYVIIDGGSTDETHIIIDKYKSRISHFVSEPDKGLYDAMNKGIALASGELIGILNSDDVLAHSGVIEHIISAMDSNTDAICSDVHIFKNQKESIVRKYRCNRWKPWMFRIGHQPPHPGFYVRRICYEKYGSFDLQFKRSADFELLLRFIKVQKIRTKFLPYTSVLMRSGGSSQQDLKAITEANVEDHRALLKHGYFSTVSLIWCKYFLKIFQWF